MIQTNIPYEVDYARPMCLNKEANDPVTIDEIRPIFIVGILFKIKISHLTTVKESQTKY